MTFPKIISGGQTGVDRGALDGALNKGVPCGIFCVWIAVQLCFWGRLVLVCLGGGALLWGGRAFGA